MAADQGYLCAQIKVAEMYKNGRGVDKSLERFLYYLNLIADYEIEIPLFTQIVDWKKHEQFREYVKIKGWLFECDDLDIQKKSFLALEKISSRSGNGPWDFNAIAKYNIAVCYELGIGTEKSIIKAIEFYLRSGAAGQSEAYNQLSRCFKNIQNSDLKHDCFKIILNICSTFKHSFIKC